MEKDKDWGGFMFQSKTSEDAFSWNRLDKTVVGFWHKSCTLHAIND